MRAHIHVNIQTLCMYLWLLRQGSGICLQLEEALDNKKLTSHFSKSENKAFFGKLELKLLADSRE